MNIENIYISSVDEIDEKLIIPNWDDINTLWGVGPSAPLHLGYDSLLILQKAILEKRPHRHFMLMADMHTILSHKLSWKEIRQRCYYYEYYFREICNLKNADYILGSYFQTRADYIEELYSVLGQTALSAVKDTLPSPKKNEMIPASIAIYSLMQCLDIFHLRANLVVAEAGQEKIYNLARDFDKCRITRPGIETKLRATKGKLIFLYIPTAHDIDGKPLRESTAKTRISIHDNKATLEAKIDRMYAPPFDQPLIEGRANAILEFFKYSVFPWIDAGIEVINVNYETIHYNTYRDLERDYNNGLFHPLELKASLKQALWIRLKYIHNHLTVGIDSWINFDKLKFNG